MPLRATEYTARNQLAEEENLEDYLDEHQFKQSAHVVDLCQLVRNGRGRCDSIEHHLPTLTTNSGKLFSKVG